MKYKFVQNYKYKAMRLKIFPFISSALLLVTSQIAIADSMIEIHPFNSGEDVNKVLLSTDLKIDFLGSGFDLIKGESDVVSSHDYSEVKMIKFVFDTQVESIIDTSVSLKVAPNPVENILTIKGADSMIGSEINIYSIDGQNKFKISNWQGESFDVSNFPSGIYIINIQSKNLKFVKL